MTSEIWLPGFDRVKNARSSGGTMVDGAPPRWTGHSTEGLSKDPHGAAAAHPFPPHCWVTLPSHKYKPRQRIQIVPLNRSAFALKHEKGDPETNRQGAVQVEIEGLSVNFDQKPDDDPFEITDEDIEWLALEVVELMGSAVGVKFAITVDTSTVSRMSWQTWARYNGLCMHRNVPGNIHTDAPLDLARVSSIILGSANSGGSLVPSGAPEMQTFQHAAGTPLAGKKEVIRIKSTGELQTAWQSNVNGIFGPFATIAGTLDANGTARFDAVAGAAVLPPSSSNPSPTIFATRTNGAAGEVGKLTQYFYDYALGKWAGPAAVQA